MFEVKCKHAPKKFESGSKIGAQKVAQKLSVLKHKCKLGFT